MQGLFLCLEILSSTTGLFHKKTGSGKREPRIRLHKHSSVKGPARTFGEDWAGRRADVPLPAFLCTPGMGAAL
mgnify:CR=1 FL=1